jgi:hypothetical protein
VQRSGSGPSRATTRVVPTMDERAWEGVSWYSRGDPLWSPMRTNISHRGEQTAESEPNDMYGQGLPLPCPLLRGRE